jgi:dolichyl-phosphate-mannose-protein mannosyltransferase
MLAAIYYFVRCVTNFTRHKIPIRVQHYAILGLLVGLTVTVKVNGLILLLLFSALFLVEYWSQLRVWHWRPILKGALSRVPVSVASVALVFLAVFYVHIGMGTKVMDGRHYKASPEYLERIANHQTWSPSTFLLGMRDNWKYMSEYADGVPRLDYCKSDENGSHAIGWPLGARTISYRWSKDTVNGQTVMYYSFLLGNPIIWLTILIGIFMSSALYVGRYVYHAPVKDPLLFNWIGVFTGLYLSYMISILQIERVMYMYHYFVPLIFGGINLALLITYLFKDEFIAKKKHTLINLGIFVALIIATFAFFSPLTYSFGLTEDQFQLRNWFEFWHMRPAY